MMTRDETMPMVPRRHMPVARATVLAAAMLTIMAAAIIAPSLPAMEPAYTGTPGVQVAGPADGDYHRAGDRLLVSQSARRFSYNANLVTLVDNSA